MSKENSNTTSAPVNNGGMGLFGDMSMLRDIIMGPKVIEYDQKFADTDALIQKHNEDTLALIKKNNEDTLALIAQNEAATKARFDALEQDMNARFDRLEQLLMQNVEKINTQMRSTSKSDKAGLADLLVELSKKLKD
ncbi:MAG: hypothetical protein JNL70_21085 [Saprospiraceae bacterium]|nr:hypothetical protein [Saprospiraceae bacterium]